MSEYPITTDRDGVRDLREMRRRLRDGDPVEDVGQPVNAGDKIVELVSAIPANDTKKHDAWLVVLVDGKWERRKKVGVRKVGAGAINASASNPLRTIATRIGAAGLCVTAGGN